MKALYQQAQLTIAEHQEEVSRLNSRCRMLENQIVDLDGMENGVIDLSELDSEYQVV